ncbi:EAL domain-containing protein [Hydrogenimonas sp. SS33]|uniref:putative bifunctional diguanylate cyclase/phosphodiesterase n=1 Tax=Hydrogenimonas leucolamina TaxID=2954236 RepID=UPI00336C20C8
MKIWDKIAGYVGRWRGREKGASEVYESFLREQVVETVCDKVPTTMVFTLFIAAALSYFLWPVVDHTLILIWLSAITGTVAVRIYHAVQHCHYGASKNLEKRYRRFRYEVTVTVLLWAAAALFLYPEGHPLQELILALIIVGMAGGGTVNLAIDRNLSRTYVVLVMSALVIRFLLCGDAIHYILALLSLIYIATFIMSTDILGKILKKGIRQYRELGLLRQRLDQIAEQAPVGIFYFDRDYNVVDCNIALSRFLRIPRENILGSNLLQLKDRRPFANVRKVIEEKRVVHYEGPYVITANGSEIWVSTVFSPLMDYDGNVIGGIAVVQDKSSEHKAQQKAEFLAYHDGLTGLPNRKLLEDRFRLQIAQAAREGYYSAILFLDLDRFKHINDTYGHGIGDELLVITAKRLRTLLRQGDTVCRLGGDEFIIFLPMLSKDRTESLEHTFHICRKIHDAMSEPIEIEGKKLYITTSIGAVIVKGDSQPLDEILRKADIAMYNAKRKGQGNTSFYEEEMDKRLRRIIWLEHQLRHAIDRDQLRLEFQPIVEMERERIYGAEALLRWRLDDGTTVSPAEFIPVAEESKLIHQIGHWVIEEVCRHIRKWEEEGKLNFYYVSVNLSSKQFRHQNFFDEVMLLVKRYGIDPRMLKFEITESVLMEESEKAREIISGFNRVGIGFMIDDFGTGYSSLSYLKRFDFETIKIDRSFIRDILTDEDDVALVRAIVDIAKQFGYTIVAEGVETREQVEKLRQIEPSILCQGFFFSPPVPEEEFLKIVSE